jgi:hypothetical protein
MPSARTLRTIEKGDWKAIFLKELEECGIVSHAAKKAGVGRTFVYEQRKEDTEFAAQWDEAVEVAMDGMEHEAWRRGRKGVLKPVYQNGKKVGVIREYSDTLLMFMMKGGRPEKFRERTETQHTGSVQVKVTYEQ